MTNPDNAIGTNAAYSGRTSVDAFNDNLAMYTSRGVISGWKCQVDTGLTVMLGGSGYVRDVAIAQDNSGNKVTINNISRDEVYVTMAAAPASNSRIDAIVAYVDNPPTGDSLTADNPAACGIIAVKGTAAVNPVEPNDSAIRTAISADGASGATAYYVILATVTIPTGTTDLIAGYIKQGRKPSDYLLDKYYPVGTYYQTSNASFDPNDAWGGTWVEDVAGRVLIAQDSGTFSTLGSTGGSEKHKHTIDARLRLYFGAAGCETLSAFDIVDDDGARGTTSQAVGTLQSGTIAKNSGVQGSSGTLAHDGFGQKTVGSSYKSSSLPPYIVVKTWHRTA